MFFFQKISNIICKCELLDYFTHTCARAGALYSFIIINLLDYNLKQID